MDHQLPILRAASEVDWLSDAEFHELSQEVLAAIDVGALNAILRRWNIAFTRNRLVNLERA